MHQKLRPLRQPLLVLLALGLWTLFCYSSSLKGPFFFDDEHFIVRNEMVHSLDHVAAIYSSAVTQGASIKGNFYRPNQQLVYALLYRLVGLRTTVPYHLVQVLLHIVCGSLVFVILLNIGLALWPAAFGAAFFLLHPVQTEAVAYISGLADPLATAFGLSAVALASHWLWGRNPRLSLGQGITLCLLLVLALFTKENAVVFGPMLLLLTAASACIHRQLPRRSQLVAMIAALLLSCAWVVLKFTVFKFGSELGLASEANAYTESLLLRLTTFVSVLCDYARLLAWPHPLFYEKPYRAYADLFAERGLFGLACLSGAGLLILQARKWPRLALGAAWFFAALLPYVGVVPLNAIFLEHWLYVPLVGLSLVIALLFAQGLSIRPRLALGAAALLLLAASVQTYLRAGEWADVEAFYLGEIAHSKDPGRIYNNLGMYYADRQDVAKAVTYYQLAADGATGKVFSQPHHNLAVAYLKAGRGQDALKSLHKSLSIDPKFIYSLRLLHDVFTYTGDQARLHLVDQAINDLKNSGNYDFSTFETALALP